MNLQYINKRQMQSLVGRLIHIAKCVPPARIFMGRLLDTLRGMKGGRTKVNKPMLDDLGWFLEFGQEWNGKSIIPPPLPTRVIAVDACLTGIGGTDGRRAYTGRIAPDDDPAANITHVEAINVLIAIHTFVSSADKGSHILVECDNLPVVHTLTTGRGRDQVLGDVARALWMVQATLDIRLTFKHVPGRLNNIADALSRAHISKPTYDRAEKLVIANDLALCDPCTYAFSTVTPPILSRSGVKFTDGESRAEAVSVQSTGYTSQPQDSRKKVPGILPSLQHTAISTHGAPGLRVHRDTGRCANGTRYCDQPHITGEKVHLPHTRGQSGHRWGQDSPGPRCHKETEIKTTSIKTSSPTPTHSENMLQADRILHTKGHQGSNPSNILRCTSPIRGSPSNNQGIRS